MAKQIKIRGKVKAYATTDTQDTLKIQVIEGPKDWADLHNVVGKELEIVLKDAQTTLDNV